MRNFDTNESQESESFPVLPFGWNVQQICWKCDFFDKNHSMFLKNLLKFQVVVKIPKHFLVRIYTFEL